MRTKDKPTTITVCFLGSPHWESEHVSLYIIHTDIDNAFKQYLKALTPRLLAPENLVVKKINGNIMTGTGLLQCFKVRVCVCVCVCVCVYGVCVLSC